MAIGQQSLQHVGTHAPEADQSNLHDFSEISFKFSRAAGASHGQETPPAVMNALIVSAGRVPKQRNTLYGDVPVERIEAGLNACGLEDIHNTPLTGHAMKQARRQRRVAAERI